MVMQIIKPRCLKMSNGNKMAQMSGVTPPFILSRYCRSWARILRQPDCCRRRTMIASSLILSSGSKQNADPPVGRDLGPNRDHFKTIDITTIRGAMDVLHLWSSQLFLKSPFGFEGPNGLLLLLLSSSSSLPCILQPRLFMGLQIRIYFMVFANFGTLWYSMGSIQVSF